MSGEHWEYDAPTKRVTDENGLKVAENVVAEDAPLICAAPDLQQALREILSGMLCSQRPGTPAPRCIDGRDCDCWDCFAARKAVTALGRSRRPVSGGASC